MKILIPNATSPKNIGDVAIITGLLRNLKLKSNLIIHSADHHLHKSLPVKPSPTLYSWAVFENRNPAVRIKRIAELLIHLSPISSYVKSLRSHKLNRLMQDYETAGIILFTGGGYLRTQSGISQALNLLMILLMFYAASRLKSKKIVAPVSFGPFAYSWQEKISASILKSFDAVYSREHPSFLRLQKHKLKNVHKSVDTSLFLPATHKTREIKHPFLLGFTIRKWFSPLKQRKFEKEFAQSIVLFSSKVKCTIRPIIQVDAPEYGEGDVAVTKRIIKILKKHNIHILPIIKVKNLQHANTTYANVDLLLGMRMHSNILSALAGTPYVGVAYEHKTTGISQDLGVKDYCIEVKQATKEKLFSLLLRAHKNHSVIKQTIYKNITEVQKNQNLKL